MRIAVLPCECCKKLMVFLVRNFGEKEIKCCKCGVAYTIVFNNPRRENKVGVKVDWKEEGF